ncbi:hypothetical protein [Priestia filamentosa]|uniref:hypothetical protein n=1 Tax=Priestia filamentosa TaxID=1402861 RepID=UPI0039819FDC
MKNQDTSWNEFSTKALELLKKQGYKPEFGARGSKRNVGNITNLLVNRILKDEKKHISR